MSILRRATKPATGVVDTVQRQTSEAAALAHIDGQERLANPRTNPVVRPHADRLQNEQQLAALDAAHTRKLRTHRVADRRAEHAERALEAIQAARETSSAAQSVLALHKGRTRFMGATMAMSLTLSIGSAMGVEQFATDNHAPGGVGYIAEVGLTGLATTAILYRSHLAQHDGKVDGWHEKALYALMFGPLIASMIANFEGAGPIGIACSVGAAAFALLSDIIASSSARALRTKVGQVSGDDEAALRAVVSGSDTFTPVTAPQVHEPRILNRELTAGSTNQDAEPEPRTMNHEVRELEVQSQQSRLGVQICTGTQGVLNLAATRTVNREPVVEVREPANQQDDEPNLEPEPQVNREPRTARTANLGERAAKKAAEVQQVLNLMDELGSDVVTLGMVQNLGFTKTTAYNRLIEARANLNQAAAS